MIALTIALEQTAYTVADVADLLRVHPVTVRRWIREGRLRAWRLGPGKDRFRVMAEDLRNFMAASTAN